ncbi:MAG: hypothetical protein ACRC33_12385, partial [Gemmataceae bacterium]
RAERQPAAPPAGPFLPLDRGWADRLKALPPAGQAEELGNELRRRNPKFDGTVRYNKHSPEATSLVWVSFPTDEVTDITPLAALDRVEDVELRASDYWNGKLEDLSPLRGMSVQKLSVAGTKVADLEPLTGMKLRGLNIHNTKVRDLSPLAGMPLQYLFCANTRVTDLSPVAGSPIAKLSFPPGRGVNLDPVRTLKALVEVNDKPVERFWKEAAAAGEGAAGRKQ